MTFLKLAITFNNGKIKNLFTYSLNKSLNLKYRKGKHEYKLDTEVRSAIKFINYQQSSLSTNTNI